MIAQIHNIVFPKEQLCIDMDTSIQALEDQRIARIAKTAFYVLGVIAFCTAVVMFEAAIFNPVILIPALAITVIAFGAFYYLNSRDERYLTGLSSETRTEVAKNALTELLCTVPPKPDVEIVNTLQNVNRLLGQQIFGPSFIKEIVNLKNNAKDSDKLSLAEQAELINAPLELDFDENWEEPSHFMLPKYVCELKITWTGKMEDELVISYKRAVASAASDQEAAPQETETLEVQPQATRA